ncbi:hypothetical protein SDC9_78152 [bioreactor metagenome]|uniref:Uncharacterized protein n=1 Tax=bioreactor metagenome TaxID=1076179 RepID=A0A644YSW1_9ZZZZ
MHAARRTDADDGFHAEDVIKLEGIDTHGRHAHAAGHNGNALAFEISRVALNAAHVVDELVIAQIRLGDELGAERIAGH